MSKALSNLETPAALIDLSRMRSNIKHMQGRMNELGVAFRPHFKTSKCLPVLEEQIAAGASGITVSTLKEAELCFAAGVENILYAVAIVETKLPQALALMKRGCRLSVITDSIAGATAIVEFGKQHDTQFNVWIEVDCDGHRSGLEPHSDVLVKVAQVLTSGGMALTGVMTHAGSSYELNEHEALVELAEQERALCVLAAERIRAAGMTCPQVSIGSTPTALSARALNGVTEVRAGVYVFFDLVMHNVGICEASDLALSVLTTVIGHQVEKGWVITDAGWMALSRDRGTSRQSHDYGYGQVCSETGEWLPGVVVASANQEHGIIEVADRERLELDFPIGKRLRIMPNHACATGAQFPTYIAVDEQGQTSEWERHYGW